MSELQRSTLRTNVYCAAAEAFISRKATDAAVAVQRLDLGKLRQK